MPDRTTIHIAAQPVQVGPQLRQRCAWCGAVLDDTDLSCVMAPEDQANDLYPTWPVGGLVAVDGGMKRTVAHEDGDVLPDECCAMLDPAVTL